MVPYRGRMVPRVEVYPAYRGFDHRNCQHPTPIPAGTRRCRGDHGCEWRLPAGSVLLCGYHADLAYSLPPAERYAALMGSRPHHQADLDALLAG